MTDKFKKRVREHAEKHGMSYQAALQQLTAGGKTAPAGEGFAEAARNLGICAVFKPGRTLCNLDHGHGGAHDYGKTGIVHRDLFDQMEAERDEARRMARALRSEAGWDETWPLPWESVDGTRKVIVNGSPAEVPAEATYEDVVEVAFPGQSAFVFSVTYRGVISSGAMWPKKSVRAEDGMIFSVADTSNA